MRKLFYGILIVAVLAIGIDLFISNKLSETNGVEEVEYSEIDCVEEIEYLFSEFPGYFESFEKGIEWCSECVNNNGIPRWSPTGPFCSLKTSDGGKTCTDSGQCEGICLAENKNSKSGECSDIKSGVGCVFEMDNGEVFEVCYD